MKKLVPTVAAAFLAATPVCADDVRVVTRTDIFQPDAIAFEVYRGREKIYNTALRCDAIRTMGAARIENMIRAYAQDRFEEISGGWEAATFEKQLQRSIYEPINTVTARCGMK